MTDRMKAKPIGRSPILSEEELQALMENKPRPRMERVPELSDQDLERLRRLLLGKRQNFKNGGAVMSGRGNNFKGVR